jgi:hypothetical protein
LQLLANLLQLSALSLPYSLSLIDNVFLHTLFHAGPQVPQSSMLKRQGYIEMRALPQRLLLWPLLSKGALAKGALGCSQILL